VNTPISAQGHEPLHHRLTTLNCERFTVLLLATDSHTAGGVFKSDSYFRVCARSWSLVIVKGRGARCTRLRLGPPKRGGPGEWPHFVLRCPAGLAGSQGAVCSAVSKQTACPPGAPSATRVSYRAQVT
jgi:hypothetical protein